MRLLYIFIVLTLIAGCAGTGERAFLGMAGLASYQNEPDGFRGIKWGQSINEIKDLHLITSDNEGLASYTRPGDSLTLGDAKLKAVQYLFWDGKFMEANISAQADQLQGLVNVLQERYGVGYRPSSYLKDYSWSGPVAFVKLRRVNIVADCEVWIRSRDISDQRNIYRGQKAHAGAEHGAQKDF